MTIDFTCQKCEASFELETESLIEGEAKIACANCGTKAPSALVEDFVAALSEMSTQVAALSKRFGISMAFESDELEEEVEADDDEEESDDDDDELDFDDEDDFDEDEDEDEDR